MSGGLQPNLLSQQAMLRGQSRLLWALSSWVLKFCRDKHCTTSLGSLVLLFTEDHDMLDYAGHSGNPWCTLHTTNCWSTTKLLIRTFGFWCVAPHCRSVLKNHFFLFLLLEDNRSLDLLWCLQTSWFQELWINCTESEITRSKINAAPVVFTSALLLQRIGVERQHFVNFESRCLL